MLMAKQYLDKLRYHPDIDEGKYWLRYQHDKHLIKRWVVSIEHINSFCFSTLDEKNSLVTIPFHRIKQIGYDDVVEWQRK